MNEPRVIISACTSSDLHPYECGGVAEGCTHCINDKPCDLCGAIIDKKHDICALCQHRETYSLADAEDVLELYAVMEQYGREMRDDLPRAVALDASKALREYALLLKALAE